MKRAKKPDIDPDVLATVLDKAGVGERTRAKVLKANEPVAEDKPRRSSGHGAATPVAAPSHL